MKVSSWNTSRFTNLKNYCNEKTKANLRSIKKFKRPNTMKLSVFISSAVESQEKECVKKKLEDMKNIYSDIYKSFERGK